jgi:cytochrome c oxidase cbb3-type subunit 3
MPRMGRNWIVTMGAGLIAATLHASAQQPTTAPQPTQQPPAPAPRREPGVFPAMQRPPADPAVVERGKGLFGVMCIACHGADARGGQLNGPNLLRSQLVLMDKDGELIGPVIQNGRPERGMPPMPIPPDDTKAIAEFIHSLTGASRGQGAPPPTDAPLPDIVVGNAAAGREYFAARCSACHSVDGDLKGIATRLGDPRMLQNSWVSGGTAGGPGGRRRGPASAGGAGSAMTATVTLPSGDKVQGRLARIDDFLVTLAQEDGTLRSFRRDGDVPRVEITDPLEGHKQLLAVLTDKDMRNVTAYLVTLK